MARARVVLPGRAHAAAGLRREFNVDTIKPTEITFDPAKNAANIRGRGLPFLLVKDEFDWTTALVGQDMRRDYGEKRYEALGYVGRRLHVVVYAPAANAIRVISFRKANKRETRKYEKATQPRTD